MLSFSSTMNSELPFLPAAGSLVYTYKPAVHQRIACALPKRLLG